MPRYIGKCTKCGELHPYHTSIKDRNHCPEWCTCGGTIKRDEEAELASRGHGGSKKWVTDNPRWSLSMGVPASQVDEFRKRFPDSIYSDDGRLLVKNQKHKHKQAKERNMVALDDNTSKAWFR
jgi:hypothetical protein